MSAAFNLRTLPEYLPIQDLAQCARVRAITRADIAKHPRKNVSVRVIEDAATFRLGLAMDIVNNIKRSLDEGRKCVLILPATNPNYAWAAEMINQLNISCKHVYTFNMDEYCDQDGNSPDRDWKGGFQHWMWRDFFGRVKPELRMPESQINFPTKESIGSYSAKLADLGGADVCYGGIGWCGHIAFVEPHVGEQVGNNLERFLEMGAMKVKLSPITMCQNSLYAGGGGAGDWSNLPWNAYTIGPKDVAGAKLRSSWNGGCAGDSAWQRFIVRLAMFGDVTPKVPASILQLFKTELVLSAKVAADCSPETVERTIPINF